MSSVVNSFNAAGSLFGEVLCCKESECELIFRGRLPVVVQRGWYGSFGRDRVIHIEICSMKLKVHI